MSDDIIIYVLLWPMRVLLVFILIIAIRRYYFGKSSQHWPVISGEISSFKSSYINNPSAINSYQPEIEYVYIINGKNYKSSKLNFSLAQCMGNKENSVYYSKKYRVGNKVNVSYNPNNPIQSVLEPGIDDKQYFITLILAVTCIGGIGFANYIF